MNSRDLEAFVAVVDTGSIVAAGTKLNLTQPGVTRRIQSLEAFLGVALLDRNAKPLKPTPAGRGAYEHGRRVLQGIEDLRGEVAPGREVRGELRLGLATHLSDEALVGVIDAARGLHPALSLRVMASWSPHLLDQVQRGELDAASICLPDGALPPESLTAIDLGTQRAFFIAAPALDVPSVAKLRDLARHPWIVSQDGCGFRTAIKRRLDAEHLPFRIAVEASSIELRRALVARGLGIGVSASGAIANDRWAGAFDIIEAIDFQLRVRCWLVHRGSLGRLERPLRVFREAIEASIRDDGLREAA